jgi:hypothetical protein
VKAYEDPAVLAKVIAILDAEKAATRNGDLPDRDPDRGLTTHCSGSDDTGPEVGRAA